MFFLAIKVHKYLDISLQIYYNNSIKKSQSQLQSLKMRVLYFVFLLLVVFSVVSASKSQRKLRSKTDATPCNSNSDCKFNQRCIEPKSGVKFCVNFV
ncbi:transmembrane protein, putative (macronuclear) [Tetrahymena thermophila SB210]|uniref:Transmembrane protein, putative n=1 Tax=Tetrahymena thermophila (strain SB210) TaxID=312017 RepID=Q24E13_TETTS|nr:transmembrane protein, putative [Tetrahymena thermophila SB210]EAS06025.2 transmembrane protein, putative [Tetrahymena thermophila SB210]|eukprot:XP_001026270.2 transmembrane protein, putative [Tetrahymena thermophila SB210]